MALRPAEPGNGPVPYWDSDAFQAVLGASEGPFFLYDLRLVEARVGWLRSQLPPEIKIYYAVKANPNPVLLTHMAQWTDERTSRRAASWNWCSRPAIEHRM